MVCSSRSLSLVVVDRLRQGSRRRPGGNGSDGHEREAQVADLAQQAMQCRLVGDGSVENGGAVGAPGQVHAVEPGGPARSEVSLQPDRVPVGLWVGTHARCLPFAVPVEHVEEWPSMW